MGALIINLAGDEVPPEDLEQHFEIQVSRETAFSRGRWLHPRLQQEEGWSVMKRPDFPFSDVYPAGRAGRICRF